MADPWTLRPGAPGEAPWQVQFSPHVAGVVHLVVGGTTMILPAMEAFKMGVALREAGQRGLDAMGAQSKTTDEP